MNSIFCFGSSLVSMFITVYLYIYADSIPLMSLYIIVRIGLFPVFFILGNQLVKKYPFSLTYFLGLSMISIALVITLFGTSLFESNPYYVLLVAAIMGSGEGFFYFSQNTCNQIVSSAESRARFLSYNGFLNNTFSLMSPVVASIILARTVDELSGYRIILVIIIVVFIVVLLMSLKMNIRSKDTDISLKKAFDNKDKMWRDHNLAVIFYGFRNALELNTISILVYNAAGNGGAYSKLQVLFSFILIISYRVIGRMLSRDNITKTFKTGVVLKILCLLVLIVMPNTTGAIIYGISNALASVYYDNSYNYLSANIICRYEGEMTARVVVRETYLSLSRCLAMGFIILCFKVLPSNIYLQVATVIISLSPIMVEKILIAYK